MVDVTSQTHVLRVESQVRLQLASSPRATPYRKTSVMVIYLSMQRVRFSSPDAYEKFR